MEMYFLRGYSLWNFFPQLVVDIRSLDMFKVETDKYLKYQGIEGYGELAQKRI